jgi:Tol biopolymer transport system component
LYAIAPGVTEQIGAPLDTWDKAKIVVRSLKSGEEKTLVDGGGAPTYVSTGHLLYVVGGTLFAVPFDYRRRELTGSAVSVVEGVARPAFTNAAPPTVYYRVADNGTLIYIPGPASLASAQFVLAYVSVDGRIEPLKLRPGSYLSPRLSPDGKQVAYGIEDGRGANVWIYDLSGTAAARQLTLAGKNRYPVWSHDGDRVAFQSDREGDLAIYAQRADGSAAAERLTRAGSNAAQVPESWSPDGQTLLYSEAKGAEFELWGLSLAEKKTFRFGDARSSTDPTSAMFSPDGKWVVYLSTDNGTRTVFVERFPANGVKHSIGTGIWHPVWSADGTRLFYRGTGAREYAIRVTTEPSFSMSNPELLTSTPFQTRGRVEREYDVTRDGRILGILAAGLTENSSTESARPDVRPTSGSAFGTAQQINVVMNWSEELKARVPAK